jgi:hypothetical protein
VIGRLLGFWRWLRQPEPEREPGAVFVDDLDDEDGGQ